MEVGVILLPNHLKEKLCLPWGLKLGQTPHTHIPCLISEWRQPLPANTTSTRLTLGKCDKHMNAIQGMEGAWKREPMILLHRCPTAEKSSGNIGLWNLCSGPISDQSWCLTAEQLPAAHSSSSWHPKKKKKERNKERKRKWNCSLVKENQASSLGGYKI